MISVCLASYNGEKYIADQINSIISQLTEDDELIISDDGSTDNTIQIINSFHDKRIHLFNNNSHCYTKNFENALTQAKGDYIFLSDQDDIWRDDKVEKSLELLQEYDFIVSNARVVDSLGNEIEASRNANVSVKNGFIRNLCKTHYLGCCMAFNKKVLKAILPFPSNHSLCLHDAWITMVSEFMFKTKVCDDCLIDYRRHNDNASTGARGISNSIDRMIKIRFYLLCEVLKRKMLLSKTSKIE